LGLCDVRIDCAIECGECAAQARRSLRGEAQIERTYNNNRAWLSFSLEYNGTNNAIATVLFNSLDQAGRRPPPTEPDEQVASGTRWKSTADARV
jgi:hypothetical protein